MISNISFTPRSAAYFIIKQNGLYYVKIGSENSEIGPFNSKRQARRWMKEYINKNERIFINAYDKDGKRLY